MNASTEQKQTSTSAIVDRFLATQNITSAMERLQKQTSTSAIVDRFLATQNITSAMERLQKQTSTSAIVDRMNQHESFQTMRSMLALDEMSEVYENVIDQIDPSSVEEMLNAIVQDSTEHDLEEYGHEPLTNEIQAPLSNQDDEWIDPLRNAVFEKSAQWLNWLQERYPGYSDRAIYALNGIVENIFTTALVVMLPIWLPAIFGPVGYVLLAIILGTAKFISDEQKLKLSRQAQNGISIECPMCHALPGMWCITVRGSAPGSAASRLHKSRLE